jgi:hypothetical protein
LSSYTGDVFNSQTLGDGIVMGARVLAGIARGMLI